jgi:hypothetical protein
MVAEALAVLDELERQDRAVARPETREHIEADQSLVRSVDEVSELALKLVRARLLLAGYYTNKGTWRRIVKRGEK